MFVVKHMLICECTVEVISIFDRISMFEMYLIRPGAELLTKFSETHFLR